jgi:hypothetical protein
MTALLIEQRIESKPNRFKVASRCMTDIAVGDIFIWAVPKCGYVDKDEVHIFYDRAQAVKLVVVEIESYGKLFNVLSKGITAQVVLEGTDELRPTPCVLLTEGEAMPKGSRSISSCEYW